MNLWFDRAEDLGESDLIDRDDINATLDNVILKLVADLEHEVSFCLFRGGGGRFIVFFSR